MPNCICTGILFADVACLPISHTPLEGELVTTDRIGLHLGGCAANVSLNLARLGVPNHLAGCVGDDALSDFILRSVSHPSIDLSLIQHSTDRCPGTAMHINVRNEDRRFICTAGANDDFVFDSELEKTLAATDPASARKVLYIGGFFMLHALETEHTIDILKQARANGWTVVLDVVLNGTRPYSDIIEPFLPHTDILIPNEHEGEKITDLRDPYDQAKWFLDSGAESVIITHGEQGTLCFSPKEQFRTGIYPTEYLSGSGAGDAFAAGLVAAFLDGKGWRDMVRWGSAAGAGCVRGVNTTETMFDRKELLDFIQEHQLVFEDV